MASTIVKKLNRTDLFAAAQRKHFYPEAAAAMALFSANAFLEMHLPATDARATALKKNVLIISCRHSAASFTVFSLAKPLLQKIKTEHPHIECKRIKTILGKI